MSSKLSILNLTFLLKQKIKLSSQGTLQLNEEISPQKNPKA